MFAYLFEKLESKAPKRKKKKTHVKYLGKDCQPKGVKGSWHTTGCLCTVISVSLTVTAYSKIPSRPNERLQVNHLLPGTQREMLLLKMASDNQAEEMHVEPVSPAMGQEGKVKRSCNKS